ncbi:MAG: flagellar assembly peptidoglycan hydrolase FlgJ [Saccharospirillaceae bacterium]|nr:flagellar assembly peptidoglycan hydrolase FlgJ [Pseudomonadales bacterium]NRB80187.1 flagellar assembly peptidoglycan hydrolase FlgJ [Saccharospirillaceae bacterium]
MTANIDRAFVYNDLAGLNSLKAQSRTDEDGALQQVAKQFESMFINMMMKSMRQANDVLGKDSMFNSQETDFYEDMYDEQLSLTLSQQGGFGVADVLYEQLKMKASSAEVLDNIQLNDINEVKQGFNLTNSNIKDITDNNYKNISNLLTPNPLDTFVGKETLGQTNTTATEYKQKRSLSSPIDFVKTLWPLAKAAAKELNIDPKLLLAQAALETGWGKKIFSDNKGNDSFNLFGIKSKDSWDGKSAEVMTHEYTNGQRENILDQFRVYDNFADSFSDYIDFIKNNERYKNALDNPKQYIEEIQNAGYATDPNYSQKIRAIAQSTMFNEMIIALNLPSKSEGEF